jgi:hypothetical protein
VDAHEVVGQELEAVLGDGWAQHVAQQRFASTLVVCRRGGGGVQREAQARGHQRCRHLDGRGASQVDGPLALSALGARGGETGDRSGRQLREGRLTLAHVVGQEGEGLVVVDDTAADPETQHPGADDGEQVAHVGRFEAREGDEHGDVVLGGDDEGGKLNGILHAYIDLCFEPIRAEGAYVITHELCERLMRELTRDAPRELIRASKADIPELPSELLFVNRLQFGFYSVLARMQVAADYSAVHRALLGRGQPPALAADA